jgi:OmcA/MtrC family decaheme c-type cytochrome
MSVSNVAVSSPPVVTFSVSDQNGTGVSGLTTDHLRFTIAKLIPGSSGNSSQWQNYILTTQTASASGAPGVGTTSVQATRENNGTLLDNHDGTYRYVFNTDITNITCPAPCTDAQGNALDVSYQANLTHRLVIQSAGGLPAANAVYTFRPSDGATSGLVTRDVVSNDSCNECHNELSAHDERSDPAYCVTCHNPGSTDPDSLQTVDFKVMIHKIHRGENLPSVDVGGGEYAIWGYRNSKHDYSTVVFPQDIRNCVKCHDGSDAATPDGDNWKTRPTMAACGSCHDDVDFSRDGSAPVNDPDGHSGGIVVDNSLCATCHSSGGPAGSVEDAHALLAKAATARFQYNIISICGTAVGSDPDCTSGVAPTVTFSVSDPTGATTHGHGNKYDVAGATLAERDPEFGSGASLNILTAWGETSGGVLEYTNENGSGSRPSRANSTSALTTATHVADGVYTITVADIIPATASGSGAIAIEGHPRTESEPGSGTFDTNVPVKGEVAYFGIDGAPVVERRVAVDTESKCDNCHDQLSLHGANRAENAQLCVLCHNPRGTDVGRRPLLGGVPDVSATLDGKREESIDLKRLIHGIHAGQKDDPATSTVEGHGFRENGLVVYGFGNNAHDYGHVRFPGILSDCTTCHNEATYELTGTWAAPTQSNILASSIETVPNATDAASYTTGINDQSDDDTISPTAAVCSACHDGPLAQAHMVNLGGAAFGVLQSSITGYSETCSVCHGPGRSADVKVVHGVE